MRVFLARVTDCEGREYKQYVRKGSIRLLLLALYLTHHAEHMFKTISISSLFFSVDLLVHPWSCGSVLRSDCESGVEIKMEHDEG